MSLNTLLLKELEDAGLSDEALRQVAVLLRCRQSGNVTWHVQTGMFVKFNVVLTGSMRSRSELARATRYVEDHEVMPSERSMDVPHH